MSEVPLYSDVLRPKPLKHKRARGACTPPALLSIPAQPLTSLDVCPAAAIPLAAPSHASATPLLGERF